MQRLLSGFIILAFLLAMTALATSAQTVPSEVSAWISSFFAAYSAGDVEKLRELFTPDATVGRRSVSDFLNDVNSRSERMSEFSGAPRGDPRVTPVTGGFSVRQPAVRTFVWKKNGLKYRHLVIYDWTLSNLTGKLLATMMNIVDEPEDNLPVGKVQITTHYRTEDGRPADSPQKVFGTRDPICLVMDSTEVQGGHFFSIQLTTPDGREQLLRGLFGLGPADKPGPLIAPVWGCLRVPPKGWPAGRWRAEVFVSGYVRGSTEWEVK